MRSDELRQIALILRAAAIYVERHGYYLSLDRVEGDDPDFDWDNYDDNDYFDKSSPTPLTPAASEHGAIAMVVYGRPVLPVDDGSPEYDLFTAAISELYLLYAPYGEGYGEWVFPYELAASLRAAANDCEFDARQAAAMEGTE